MHGNNLHPGRPLLGCIKRLFCAATAGADARRPASNKLLPEEGAGALLCASDAAAPVPRINVVAGALPLGNDRATVLSLGIGIAPALFRNIGAEGPAGAIRACISCTLDCEAASTLTLEWNGKTGFAFLSFISDAEMDRFLMKTVRPTRHLVRTHSDAFDKLVLNISKSTFTLIDCCIGRSFKAFERYTIHACLLIAAT